jgi:beta-lactamase regulating signal transducer with metallopeptidase domain
MSTLESWYPGDRIVACLLVMAAAVTVVSTISLMLSRGLKSHSALRHLVLFSALICNLATPLIAAAWIASGIAPFSLRLFFAGQSKASTEAMPAPDHDLASASFESIRAVDAAQPPDRTTTTRRTDDSRSIQAASPAHQSELALRPKNVIAPQPNWRRRMATFTALVWLIGTGILLFGFATCCWRVRAIREAVRPAADVRLPILVGEVQRLVGVSWPPKIGVSTRVFTPVVAGWIRPVIILPELSLSLITRDQLRDVLVHELAHLVRRDQLVMPLQLLAKALFWPTVVIHVLNRQLICAREDVCDNFVLATRDPLSYCETLLRLAELGRGTRPPVATMGILHRRGTLEDRIASLIREGRDTQRRTGRLVALTVFALFATASSLLCGTQIVAEQGPASEAVKTGEGAAPVPPKAGQKSEVLRVTGRVWLPNGSPAAQAHVQIDLYNPDATRSGFVLVTQEAWAPLASVVTDAEGRFSQDVDRKWQPDDHTTINVTAAVPGYGVAMSYPFNPARKRPLELRLVEDEPVRGRVLDLQGRPVAGARLDVRRMCCSTRRLVDRWLTALPPNPVFAGYGSINDDEAPFMYGVGSSRTPHFPGNIAGPSPAVIPTTSTDADGRFEIHGLGRDRLIFFKLSGPAIAATELRVLTRPIKTIRFERLVGSAVDLIYGPSLEYVAAPGIALEGTVTDEDSAAPLPGVVIECKPNNGRWGGGDRFLSATTDERGQYRIEGLPADGKNSLKVEPQGPYLHMDGIEIPQSPGLQPIRRDIKLKRGLWAVGRAFNLNTGEPVRGTVYYTPFRSNANARSYARYSTKTMGMVSRVPLGHTDADGRFRIPIIPGRGVVCLKTWNFDFRPGFGAAEIKELAHKEKVRRSMADEPTFDSVPTTWFSAVREVNASLGAQQVEIDLPVDPGQNVALKFVDRAGNRLSGVDTYRLEPQHYFKHTDTNSVIVPATSPDETRVVWLKHKSSGLTKSLRFTPKPSETERTVRLEPPAVIVGRLVNPQGLPVRDVRLDWRLPDMPINANPLTLTDANGRFRFEVPGGEPVRLVAAAAVTSWNPLREELAVESGEQIDLGKIVYDYDMKKNFLRLQADPERRTKADGKNAIPTRE